MIIKLTLETENCVKTIHNFLKQYDFLRWYPFSTRDFEKKRILPTNYIRDNKQYNRIITLPDTTIENGKVVPIEATPEQITWIQNVIKDAFDRFASSDYERNSFHVEVVPYCDASWGNGKTFYVFPTCESPTPVLNF